MFEDLPRDAWSAMKAISSSRPVHLGQASTSIANTFFKAEESSREVRAIYARLEEFPRRRGIVQLPRGYPAAGAYLAERRLAQAGVRLAAVLDRVAAERGGTEGRR